MATLLHHEHLGICGSNHGVIAGFDGNAIAETTTSENRVRNLRQWESLAFKGCRQFGHRAGFEGRLRRCFRHCSGCGTRGCRCSRCGSDRSSSGGLSRSCGSRGVVTRSIVRIFLAFLSGDLGQNLSLLIGGAVIEEHHQQEGRHKGDSNTNDVAEGWFHGDGGQCGGKHKRICLHREQTHDNTASETAGEQTHVSLTETQQHTVQGRFRNTA